MAKTHAQLYSSDVAKFITAEDLRSRLGRELDALRDTSDALYVSKRGRLSAVVVDSEHYAAMLDRLEFLEDSLAALTAREESEQTARWQDIRDG